MIRKAKIIDLAFESHKTAMVREYSELISRGDLSRDILVTVLSEKADTLNALETNAEECVEGVDDAHVLTGS